MPNSPHVSVIIPSFNGRPFLETCIGSVLRSDYSDFELIFVDDRSTDGSSEFISHRFASDPRIVIVQNERNLGAAAARNRAVSRSHGEILIFLDNDTEIEPSTIGELVDALNDSTIDAVQAKIMDFERRSVIQHAGVSLVPFTAWAIARGGGEIDCGQWDRPDEVLALSTCLAVRKPAFEEVGGFDERLRVHSEDIDFSWRLWLAGHRTILSPSARVYHKNKSLADRKIMAVDEYKITFYLERNALLMLLKNLSPLESIKYLAIGLITTFIRASVTYAVTGRLERLRASLSAVIWNMKFIEDTLQDRRRVQRSLRRVSDNWLRGKIVDPRPLSFFLRQTLRQFLGQRARRSLRQGET